MLLHLLRIGTEADSTLGALYIDGVFECWTLEDTKHLDKIPGETRIPAGLYRITLRKEGGIHKKYFKRFDFHQGMLHIRDVPRFTWIYMHTGVHKGHTLGCVLVGDSIIHLPGGQNSLGYSSRAYKRMYLKVIKQLNNRRPVQIRISDIG